LLGGEIQSVRRIIASRLEGSLPHRRLGRGFLGWST
jgi:hypothetical protein